MHAHAPSAHVPIIIEMSAGVRSGPRAARPTIGWSHKERVFCRGSKLLEAGNRLCARNRQTMLAPMSRKPMRDQLKCHTRARLRSPLPL
jgi:hypothetical protein